jgi:aryl-alcohol dehydrogenase (NADP+)
MDFQIADRVVEIAEKRGCKPVQIAVAWLLGKPGVACPVVGVSKVSQLEGLVEAAGMILDPEEVTYLEELYQPVDNLLSIGSS